MRYSLIIILFSLSACSFFKKKQVIDKDVIARVNEDYLYASELGNLTKGLSGEDSVEVLKRYAETWVRKKLLLQKAEDNVGDDDPAFLKKMEDYRETLLLYEYEKALIDQKLDTSFSGTELNEWYEKMKAEFPIENDVYRICYIKLKKDAPDLNKVKKWILHPKNEEEEAQLKGYCKEFAVAYSIENGVWLEKETATFNYPIKEGDVASLAATKQYKEFKTDDMLWYIKVAEVLKKGEASPPEFVSDKIKKAIIEKRRVQLVEKTYDKIYKDGQTSKAFEVYVK